MKRFIILFGLLFGTPLVLLQSLPVFAQVNLTFVPITPCRIIDTREPTAGGQLIRLERRDFNVVGPTTDYSDQGGTPAGCGIPSRVRAVAINFIAVNPAGSGNMQAWPSSQDRPTNPPASVINFSLLNPFPTIANGIIIRLGPTQQGDIAVLATQNVDLVADVYGYFPEFSNVIRTNAITSLNDISARDIDIIANQDIDMMLDNDNAVGSFLDTWSVYHNGSFNRSNKLAELNESGELRIRGTLFQETSFDIAEIYESASPNKIMPGHVVSFTDPDTVELANRSNCSKVLGPVSKDPGIVLGGAFLDEASLEKYGHAMMSKYGAEKKQLMGEYKSLFKAQDKEDKNNKKQEKEKAKLESLAMEIFVAEHFVPVALAGKVPVKVFGKISAGDPLSPGRINGVAEKARGESCPTIGVAMQDHHENSIGEIMVFVTRR